MRLETMTKSFKGLGINMVALGLGPNTIRATTIANNLRHLGYEKTMAVSRLNDIPSKVIRILDVRLKMYQIFYMSKNLII